jgi:hypothetical protein
MSQIELHWYRLIDLHPSFFWRSWNNYSRVLRWGRSPTTLFFVLLHQLISKIFRSKISRFVTGFENKVNLLVSAQICNQVGTAKPNAQSCKQMKHCFTLAWFAFKKGQETTKCLTWYPSDSTRWKRMYLCDWTSCSTLFPTFCFAFLKPTFQPSKWSTRNF